MFEAMRFARVKRECLIALTCLAAVVGAWQWINYTLWAGHESDRYSTCQENLRRIHVALLAYAKTNGGFFPPSLDAIIVEPYLGDPQARYGKHAPLVCPSAKEYRDVAIRAQLGFPAALPPSYRYIADGLTLQTMTDKSYLVVERVGNHTDGVVMVLSGDGQVSVVETDYRKKGRTPMPRQEWLDVEAQIGRGDRPVQWPEPRSR